jgi:hypothetical protein
MKNAQHDTNSRYDARSSPDAGRFAVRDEGHGHKYFTQTCNLIDDIPLTLYERALYKCLKRICGEDPDGFCSRSTETLAAMTGMSAGSVSKAKEGLLRTDRAGLNGKALIRVGEIDGRPGRAQHCITVVDIWPENMAYYAALYERKRTGGIATDRAPGSEHQPQADGSQGSLFLADQSSRQSSPGELQSSRQSSPGEPKKTLRKSLRRRPQEEQQQPPYPPKGSRYRGPGDAAAAEDSPVGEGEGPSPEAAQRLSPPRVYPVVPSEEVQKVMDAGCTRADAEALVAEVPWQDIADQIAWLPWRNCESPRYWLPRYVRDGWPRPKGLRDHEAAQEAEVRRREKGVSREEEARREKADREGRARRRTEFAAALAPDDAAALASEAHERLLRDGVPGGASTGGFWRDWAAEKGTGGKAYRQARDAVRALIIDERIAGVKA